MFEIGEYIVYGSKGVCQVEDISQVDIPGASKDRLYYVLRQLENGAGKIYVPTDNDKVVMRKIITREAAEELIQRMPEIEQMWVDNDKQREAMYKEAIRTCDYNEWVRMIKTLYFRKKERTAQGKKVTALDEKYLKAAENELYSELSLTLGIPKTEVLDYIKEHIGM
ncbi:MAG: CarD family transcriptional regulator [Lachnospiraceae bacterium]|nr:CarD family transcriptional regulator [Lachnospiraceae bacterium]